MYGIRDCQLRRTGGLALADVGPCLCVPVFRRVCLFGVNFAGSENRPDPAFLKGAAIRDLYLNGSGSLSRQLCQGDGALLSRELLSGLPGL